MRVYDSYLTWAPLAANQLHSICNRTVSRRQRVLVVVTCVLHRRDSWSFPERGRNTPTVASPFKDLASGTVFLLSWELQTFQWLFLETDWKLICLTPRNCFSALRHHFLVHWQHCDLRTCTIKIQFIIIIIGVHSVKHIVYCARLNHQKTANWNVTTFYVKPFPRFLSWLKWPWMILSKRLRSQRFLYEFRLVENIGWWSFLCCNFIHCVQKKTDSRVTWFKTRLRRHVDAMATDCRYFVHEILMKSLVLHRPKSLSSYPLQTLVHRWTSHVRHDKFVTRFF